MPQSENADHSIERAGRAGRPDPETSPRDATRGPRSISAAAIYVRVLPPLALALLAWLVVGDSVLEHTAHGKSPIVVRWGLRTITSLTGEDDPSRLVRTYGEAVDQIDSELARAPGEGALQPARRRKALDTLDAYRSLLVRGWLAFAILVIAALLFALAGFRRGVEVQDRAKTHLIAAVIVFVGVSWFRWSFSRAAGSMAYASEGDYGFTVSAILVLGGVFATALVAVAIWRSASSRQAARRATSTTSS